MFSLSPMWPDRARVPPPFAMTNVEEKKQPQKRLEPRSAQFVRGIGPRRFEALNRIGVHTVKNLCYFFPRRYEDRTRFESVANLKPGMEVTLRGEILAQDVKPLKKFAIFEMVVGDSTGTIQAVWFNQPYLKNQFRVGDQVILSGKVECYHNQVQLNSPEYERIERAEDDPIHVGRIIPIYPLTEGLVQRSLRQAMKEVIDRHVPNEIEEFLPEEIRSRNSLLDLTTALRTMHFPEDWRSLEQAQKRIIFDEFFTFELMLLSKIRGIRSREKSMPFEKNSALLSNFRKALPFELTNDQEQAVKEITDSVSQTIPMNRLLQGEVGSGKTVVAAAMLYLAAQNRLQSALVAPTEILAEQHFGKLKPFFESLGVQTALLTGSVEENERSRVYEQAQAGAPTVFIGTHALLQEEVQFQRLGLVVIDEQHRFGVAQRAKLLLRRPRPHLLVMTATPIPRTLGLTLYGDLDMTILRQLPKGRKQIKTYWIDRDKEEDVLKHIRNSVAEKDEQAYILFPIIEETERSDLQAATQEFERLQKGIFRGIPLGLVHGRLAKKERDNVMTRFHSGEIKVLVATSVVEVGIDNPNVTYMVIENAERFGLSQLHQMRGRIGRGTKESMCFLFGNPTTEDGKKRLRILTKTNDGFTIAEEDLALRGPGDFFGTRQTGLPYFRVASLTRDVSLLLAARNEAAQFLERDPDFSQPEHNLLAAEIAQRCTQFTP